MKTPANNDAARISEFFERDHREIDALLNAAKLGSPASAVAPFEEFDRRLERHIDWEEDILFPAVCAKEPGLAMGPIRMMKFEHEQIRKSKAAALAALRAGDARKAIEQAAAMLDVLKGHNVKEEQILYPACDELLSLDEAKAVLDRVRAV